MISTYSELQTAITNWLNRDPGTDRVKEFIELAESRFRRVLKDLNNEVRSQALVPAGGFVALPDGYNGLRDAYVPGTPKKPLTIIPPTQMTDWGDLSGQPWFITVTDGQFRFSPDLSGETVEVIYFRKLISLSDAAPTNYLIDDYNDVYLAGSLIHAKGYLKEDDFSFWKAALTEWEDEMDKQSRDQKYAMARKQVGQNTTIPRLG